MYTVVDLVRVHCSRISYHSPPCGVTIITTLTTVHTRLQGQLRLHTNTHKHTNTRGCTNRWAYTTSTLLPMHKIRQIRHRKGDGLIVHRGRIIRYTTRHTIGYCLFPSDIGSRYLPSDQGLPPSPAPGQRSALCCRALGPLAIPSLPTLLPSVLGCVGEEVDG